MEAGTVIVTIVAVYGAILSTFNAYQAHNKNKISVKVNGFIGKMIPDETDGDYLIFSFTNTGQRPVFIHVLAVILVALNVILEFFAEIKDRFLL